MTQNTHPFGAVAEQREEVPVFPGDQGQRLARVRINAAGERAVGLVALGSRFSRLSDLLNSPTRFFSLFEDDGEGEADWDRFRVIAKAAVAYVEAVGEATRFGIPKAPGEFVPIEFQLASPAARASAEVFVATATTLEEVLENGDPFLNLSNVAFHRTLERYPYIAVGKGHLVSVTPARGLGLHAAQRVVDNPAARALAG